jgi:hypothetical protein
MSFAFDPGLFVEAVRSPDPAALPPESSLLDDVGALLAPVTLSMQSGVVARYQREDIGPGSSFQLGWGGADRFREVDGVAATSLSERRDFAAGSGLRLPGTLTFNANYRRTRSIALDARSERESRVTTWPDLRVAMADAPIPGVFSDQLERFSWSVGTLRTIRHTDYGGSLFQRRITEDHRIPIEVALEWSAGIVTRYRGQVGWGSGLDPTGETERNTMDHGLSIETRGTPGRGDMTEAESLRLSVLLTYATAVECRIVTGRTLCVDFIHQVSRGASLVVDTWFRGLEVGGQLGVVDRRSLTGAQLGFTQLQLGVWGRMLFEAGPIGRLLGDRRDPF